MKKITITSKKNLRKVFRIRGVPKEIYSIDLRLIPDVNYTELEVYQEAELMLEDNAKITLIY